MLLIFTFYVAPGAGTLLFIGDAVWRSAFLIAEQAKVWGRDLCGKDV